MNNQDWLEVLTAHFVHITLAVVLIRFLQEPTCRMIFDREYTQGCQKWHWSRSQAFHTLPEVQVIKLQIASQSYKDPEELDVMWSKCVFVSTLHARWGKIPLEAWRSFILGTFFLLNWPLYSSTDFFWHLMSVRRCQIHHTPIKLLSSLWRPRNQLCDC